MKNNTHALSPKRLYTLDALRGIAILLIMLFHATELFRIKLNQAFLFNSFRFADAGVEFFFVLSGFTLVWTYADRIGKERNWRAFILKRVLRIYPFYWLVNLVVIAAYFLVPALGDSYKKDVTVILKSFLLVPQQQAPILAVAWFLSHILLFYAIFSLLIALKPKFSLPIVASWLVLSIGFNIVTYLSAYKTQWVLSPGYNWTQFLLSLYGIEFAAGGLIAFWLIHHPPTKRWCSTCFAWSALAFIFFGVIDNILFEGTSVESTFEESIRVLMTDGYEFVAYGITSIFLIGSIAGSEYRAICLRDKPTPVVKRLRQLPKWLGSASYSIFLTHFPVLSLGMKLFINANLNAAQMNIGMICCCLIACLIGWFGHRYIERPSLQFIRVNLKNKVPNIRTSSPAELP